MQDVSEDVLDQEDLVYLEDLIPTEEDVGYIDEDDYDYFDIDHDPHSQPGNYKELNLTKPPY